MILDGEAGTVSLARRIAVLCAPGDVIALFGDLGAGKSVFARGFVRGLIPEVDEVPSPTFTLVQVYDAPRFEVHHFDLYRLSDPDDALELGIEESFAEAVSIIEWPARLGPYLPAHRLEITLKPHTESETLRHADLTPHGSWAERLAEADLGSR